MNIDEDYIPLALIALLTVVWVSGLWHNGETTKLAADVLNFGIGAIAGYMARERSN